jgi:DNA-binding winged helix-turn-helix (wHTH) protein/Tol biopolymer transport system component
VAFSTEEEVVGFGLFELDLRGGQLRKNGRPLRLAQQPLQLLAALVERPGEIVTREELRGRLWSSDVFVDFEHGLNKSMQKLREALGDSATSPRYIETIPRVGYRFIAPVRNKTPTPNGFKGDSPQRTAESPVPRKQAAGWMIPVTIAVALCAAAGLYWWLRPSPRALVYTQLTDFPDPVSTPALSPDGHMLAFIRGGSYFMSADEIYIKMLPNGEAKRVTGDARMKYDLAFSADGTQLAYTVLEGSNFSTYTVSVLGGDPHLLLSNAAGLSWLTPEQVLFSRIRSGLHMGVVTQAVNGGDFRELYYPPHERAMAHYSFASPDRRWALVVVMNGEGKERWARCQLISLAGRSDPRTGAKPVGPEGECTAAGWSPDGRWMYFIATVEGASHLWRQRFTGGSAEQLTFGPADEQGLAVEWDGRSVITSVGITESAIWIHDGSGERLLSSEGEVTGLSRPSFRDGDKTLYYLLRHPAAGSDAELWRMTVDSGRSEAVFPGTAMYAYDLSPDGKQVVYASEVRGGASRLWLVPLDRSSPAKAIGPPGAKAPYFGLAGTILFLQSEGTQNYLERVNQDGSGRALVLPYPIMGIESISPGRKWLVASSGEERGGGVVPEMVAIPLEGGAPRRLCANYCVPVWSPSGRFLYVPVEPLSEKGPGRSLVIPVGAGEALPPLPTGGISALTDAKVVAGAQSIPRADLVPGEEPGYFAYVKTTTHRNLYRISLP